MLVKNVVIVVVLCLLGGLLLFGVTDTAYAQGNAGGDKSLASKRSGELATKKFDAEKLPGKLEIGLAVGSIVVLIAAFKWL